MNSNLLEQIGLQNLDPAYFIIGLIVICLGLLIYIITVHRKLNLLMKKYRKFMSGKDAKSLEGVTAKRFEQVEHLMQESESASDRMDEMDETMLKVFQKMGIVKYDAFSEMGGKLSFAIALLDKENTGFILNSMHSREGCYTYIKEIIKGESYVLLGEEEKEALEKAVNYDNFMVQ